MEPFPRHRFVHEARVLLAFAVLSVAMTWPLAARMSDHVLGAKYHWDAYTNTMLMTARVRGAFSTGPGDVYDNYFFAPIDGTLAFNENLFGLSLLFAPCYLVTGNPLLSYNFVLLASLALSGYFTFLFVRRLTGSASAAFVSGVAFAFCPYAMFEMGRIQLVATQWIPLCFLFLHRVFERKQFRDALGFAAAYALQVGTCLYYAMFIQPLLVLVGVWLLVRNAPFTRGFWLKLAAAGLACGAAIVGMTRPYFAARRNFDLTRTEDFAERFDGNLSFLLNVHPTNKLLGFLHHLPPTDVGAHEEIAFPGFTIGALALVALLGPALTLARTRSRLALAMALAAGTFALGWLGTIYTASLLAAVVVVVAAAMLWRRFGQIGGAPASPAAPYAWALLLALALFLGITPFEHAGKEIRGLYYYLYTYVPGFDGMRKVSRQAIVVMFAFSVLAGFGGARLFEHMRTPRARVALLIALVALVSLEFLSAPSALASVPSGAAVPRAYRWIAARPGPRPIAVIPGTDGVARFRGPPGMALHNYMATLHGRRIFGGKSSWIPPVTEMFYIAARRIPQPNSLRILQNLEAEFLVVHTGDMPAARAESVLRELNGRTDIVRHAFEADGDHVYEFVAHDDPTLTLLKTPPLPEGLRVIDRRTIEVHASRGDSWARRALDENPETLWGTRRDQRVDDWFEFTFASPTRVAAIEFTNYRKVFDAPIAFRLEAFDDAGTPRTLLDRPRLQILHDQVHSPRQFVFRIVLPSPVEARRLRFTLREAVPGRWWTIPEARLWAPKG